MNRTFKWLFLILILCLWVNRVHAAEPALDKPTSKPDPSRTAAPQGAPSIQVPETVFDFGEAMEGAEVPHEFTVRNTGSGTLQIDQVRPGCGCTAAQFDRTIPPSGESKITLKLNLKGYQGSVKKTATVHCNDPKQPRITLAMQGTVKTLIDVRPSSSVTFRGPADQQAEKVIDLVGSSEPFHIQKVESSLDEKITHKIETVENGKHYRLKLDNVLKQGNYSGFLKVYTDFPQKPEIIIRITGSIEGDIAVRPQTILVGKLAARQPPRQGKILVVSNREKTFHITKLSYDEQLIKVTQVPLDKEPGYVLEISPIMENIPAGSRRQVLLTVETDATPTIKYDVQVHLINFEDSPSAAGNTNR